MDIFSTKKDLISYVTANKNNNMTIGFVPTMGALHKGHLSLVKKAKKKTDIVIVSIFVNPTQFDNTEDLEKYPNTLENDIKLLNEIGCNAVYTPDVKDIYDNTIVSKRFSFDGLEHQMEGEFRKGHFNGVATVVTKLFKITTPDIAFFGKKDFQQLQIIKKLVKKENLPIKIKGCAIFREKDGLAMSSRNIRLTEKHRETAPFIYKTLKKSKKRFKRNSLINVTNWVEKQFLKNELLELEYFKITDEETLQITEIKDEKIQYRAFISVYAGEIRLIDNIKL